MVRKFTFEEKFCQISHQVFLWTSEARNSASNVTPQTFHILCVSTRNRINEILRMIYSLVHKTLRRQTLEIWLGKMVQYKPTVSNRNTRNRINEILRMIYSLVHKTLRRQTVVSSPTIGHYSGAWPYPLLNDRQKSLWIPRRHRHKKSPSRATFETAKNPKSINPTSPVILSMTYFGFINFNHYSVPPKSSLLVSSQNTQTSRQKLLQSTTVRLLTESPVQ